VSDGDAGGLDAPVESLPGVGPATAAALAARGLERVGDLLFFLPRRWDDERVPTPIGALEAGAFAVVDGVVAGVRQGGPPRRGGGRLEVTLEPAPEEPAGHWGALRLVWFRAPPGLRHRFQRGRRARAAGKVELYRGVLQMAHPEVTLVDGAADAPPPGRIRPRYGEVPGVAPRTLEKAVRAACARGAGALADLIPEDLRGREGLPGVGEVVRVFHDPPADLPRETLAAWNEGCTPGHLRLALEELFLLEIALHRRRARERFTQALPLPASSTAAAHAIASLPFPLTGAQERVVAEIAEDLARPQPMRRLLQGDVGSGKTAVAFLVAAQAVAAGAQVAFMVPTELLAEQQIRTFDALGKALGMRVALVVGGARAAHRRKLLRGLDAGTIDVAVGTHALLSEGLAFRKLGLVIVDEQHRFGVGQRLKLSEKGPRETTPHLLVMTATPIPRSLALAVYGDLDTSVLDERPPGRTPPVTRSYPAARREAALRQVERGVAAGGQAFVVCPAVEDGEERDLRSAVSVFAELSERFRDLGVALVHGRQDFEERQSEMARFVAGEAKVLVSTTVIEVGVDVPRANVILIEDAERFGLAQLHQLRGRVGRGGQRSACLLVTRAREDGDAAARLSVLCRTDDGFEIAEEDLQLRGPGEVFGRRQSGLPGFRFADLRRDRPLLERARALARELVERDPTLGDPAHAAARRAVEKLEAARALVGEEAG